MDEHLRRIGLPATFASEMVDQSAMKAPLGGQKILSSVLKTGIRSLSVNVLCIASEFVSLVFRLDSSFYR
jgi:hypothetical protein